MSRHDPTGHDEVVHMPDPRSRDGAVRSFSESSVTAERPYRVLPMGDPGVFHGLIDGEAH